MADKRPKFHRATRYNSFCTSHQTPKKQDLVRQNFATSIQCFFSEPLEHINLCYPFICNPPARGYPSQSPTQTHSSHPHHQARRAVLLPRPLCVIEASKSANAGRLIYGASDNRLVCLFVCVEEWTLQANVQGKKNQTNMSLGKKGRLIKAEERGRHYGCTKQCHRVTDAAGFEVSLSADRYGVGSEHRSFVLFLWSGKK